MGSIPTSVGIQEGLGDCIVAAASVQKLARESNSKIKFNTSPKLQFLFDNHPDIQISNEEPDIKLKWPSQINYDLFNLHTMQRFATQLGLTVSPTEVVDLYDSEGERLVNTATNTVVCLNELSAEPLRRFIPEKEVRIIEDFCTSKGYKIVRIGDCRKNSEKDISKCVELLRHCKLFIGPISFHYHLASAIRVKCLLFTSYMPHYSYSHFFNTTSINSSRQCVHLCEKDEAKMRRENDCWSQCKAVDYREEEIKIYLEGLLS